VALNEHELMGVVLSGGQAGDAPVGEEMLVEVLKCEGVKAVGADKAYDSNAIRKQIAQAGKEAVIPPRSNRREPADYDKEKYKERNKIERLFGRLKQFRAIATRYDKLAEMFLGGVIAALLVISLKS
jgi:transposase